MGTQAANSRCHAATLHRFWFIETEAVVKKMIAGSRGIEVQVVFAALREVEARTLTDYLAAPSKRVRNAIIVTA